MTRHISKEFTPSIPACISYFVNNNTTSSLQDQSCGQLSTPAFSPLSPQFILQQSGDDAISFQDTLLGKITWQEQQFNRLFASSRSKTCSLLLQLCFNGNPFINICFYIPSWSTKTPSWTSDPKSQLAHGHSQTVGFILSMAAAFTVFEPQSYQINRLTPCRWPWWQAGKALSLSTRLFALTTLTAKSPYDFHSYNSYCLKSLGYSVPVVPTLHSLPRQVFPFLVHLTILPLLPCWVSHFSSLGTQLLPAHTPSLHSWLHTGHPAPLLCYTPL